MESNFIISSGVTADEKTVTTTSPYVWTYKRDDQELGYKL
jgi:hypothetical protein